MLKSRPLLVLAQAAITFALINWLTLVALGLKYDIGYHGRVSPDLSQFDPLSIEDMLDTAAGSDGRKIFWIGDSIVHGAGADGLTAPQLLENQLRGRYGGANVHVFNAAMPATRTGDKYGVLRRVLDAKPSLVILELKYNEFSRAQVEGVPFRYPYLNEAVSSDPDYVAHIGDFPAVVPLAPPMSDAQLLAGRYIDRLVALARFRGLIEQTLAGGDVFARLEGAPPAPALPQINLPLSALWSTRQANQSPTIGTESNPAGRIYANFAPAYQSGPFDGFPNASLYFLGRISRALDDAGTPAIVYFAALNHSLLGTLTGSDTFAHNVGLIDGMLGSHRFAYSNYEYAMRDDDADFIDTEHLTRIGLRMMVDRIIRDHAAVFDAALKR